MRLLRSLRAVCVFTGAALSFLALPAAATPITLVDDRIAGFVGMAQQGPLDTPVEVDGYPEYTGVFGGSTSGLADPYLEPSVAAFFANGGHRLIVVRVAAADDASLIGIDTGVAGTRTGLQALRDTPASIVAVPGAGSLAVQSALIAVCESMGDRLAILDSASPSDLNAVTAQRASLGSVNGYAALYFPWVQAAPTGVSLLLPPSGFVAGVVAATSPAVSPTGSLSTVTGLGAIVNTTQAGTLNTAGICAIRQFAGPTYQIWGARTIASNTEYQYIVVRREASAIATSIRVGAAWCLGVPNDATLWAQLTSDMDDFLHMLWLGGWFQGTTPTQAYLARCDATTMTAQDTTEGRTILLAGFAPLRPAEFVLLQVTQQRAPAAAVVPGVAGFAFAAPSPNPFTARTTLAFELPSEGAVTLRVYDVRGRRVRTLLAGANLVAGRHVAIWDGREDAGGRAAPGVYFARLEAGGRTVARRVALGR
jgi:hypothetical protein